MMLTASLAPLTAWTASPLLWGFYDGSCGLCSAQMAALH
jgi:hypothetical protein